MCGKGAGHTDEMTMRYMEGGEGLTTLHFLLSSLQLS